jgi:hypothetical protein
MNKKLTFFQETALDLLFFKHNYEDTWYNIVINKVPFLTETDTINPIFENLIDIEIKHLLIEIENLFQDIYQQAIIDFNEKNIDNINECNASQFIKDYYMSNEKIQEQIEEDAIYAALEEIFCEVNDNTYNRYLEGKLKTDPSNNSDEDFDVVCEKYEMYGERLLLEEIESLSYNYKQIMNKYYQLGKKGN